MRDGTGQGPAAIVVSDVFPPEIGGSGELLFNVYRRFEPIPVTVLAAFTGRAEVAGSTLTVVRDSRPDPPWGVMTPAGFRHHRRQASRLRALLRQQPSVVHCARLLPEGLGARLAALTGPIKYLAWAHGEELAFARSSRELSFLMTRVHRRAAALIANSENTARMLREAGVSAGKIEVVYPGVDAARFAKPAAGVAELRRSLAEPGDVVILTVGRLQRRKGHDLVLSALRDLPAGSTNVRYVIVGDGEERARLEQMTRDYGLSDRVRFAGAVSGELLPMYYAAADVFVHPNRVDGHDVEGFGIVFLEAAACGLPVIAGDSGGVPEAVGKGTGILVSGTSGDEVRAAIARLAASPDLRRTLGDAGRERVRREFTWERAASQVRAIHERVARD